ncbi:hypothetical protein AN958_01993 [Leucoagaricus sp. SymC.cos]|nr:hypothetical protein AN958_01993 [Leucoagaricus sp. SymC.cos]
MLSLALSRRTLLSGNVFLSFSRTIHGTNTLPIPPKLNVLETPEDTAQARYWAVEFKETTIPRSYVELQFARSSGPGGQNVNKVNTKAIIKCPLNSSWIPAWARAELLNSPYYISSSHSIQVASTSTRSQAQNIDDCLAKPYYISSSHSIQVASTSTRSQAQNIDDCLAKLHAAILSASTKPIKNEPSEQQKKKVEKFKQVEKAKRKSEKMHRSNVKRSRSSKDWF